MTSGRVQVTFDCADPPALARFWSAVLGYPEVEPSGPDGWTRIEDPAGRGPRLAFQRVPEPKATKNRLHLDVWADGDRDAEVARLEALGAVQQQTVTDESGTFVILLDPEGNEFCLG